MSKFSKIIRSPTLEVSSLSGDDCSDMNGSKENFNFKGVYSELQEISQRLKEENEVLTRRERDLQEREEMLSVSQSSMVTVAELSVKQRLDVQRLKYEEVVEELQAALKEKEKENRRLRENFETIKLANDALKKELESALFAHDKLEKQSQNLQSRISNLQRRNEISIRSKTSDQSLGSVLLKESQGVEVKKNKSSKKVPKLSLSMCDLVSGLLEWITDSRLRPCDSVSSSQQDHDLGRCLKSLPSVAEYLRSMPPNCSTKVYLPCLQFVYWSLLYIDDRQMQKSSLTSTMRRLGDELFRPCTIRGHKISDISAQTVSSNGSSVSENRIYFNSSDLHIRFLSSLIILKTLSQADQLAQVFYCVKVDLKNELCKELFLYYRATAVFLPFLRPIYKSFQALAIDIFCEMSSETPFLTQFLKSCSDEAWFRSVTMAIRSPTIDIKILEKITVILMKLSKNKANKKYFDVYLIGTAIQELLRTRCTDQPFLSINLKAILNDIS